jgi:hypothetical protein
MKAFRLLKIPALLLGLGALLFLTPTCKAQSEVSPDHFDGTDTWEKTARKPTLANGSVQAQNAKTVSGASLQLAAARNLLNATQHNPVAIEDKRKTAVRKSNKQ